MDGLLAWMGPGRLKGPKGRGAVMGGWLVGVRDERCALVGVCVCRLVDGMNARRCMTDREAGGGAVCMVSTFLDGTAACL
mmetsp:Transcript_35980/g.70804  ORF Transcript_35980/g.70804 Transcript_35980/m.70804 type:complete len:80 (-) Transcript_35980:400-639(-)